MSDVCVRGGAMIFDTDVLIWALRGNAKAARAIEQDEERAVSAITIMELLQGARDKQELAAIRSFLLEFDTLPVSETISHRACIYMEQYALSVSLCPMDALVAATASEQQLLLCTGNAKHYRQIPGIELKTFRP